MYSRQRVDLKLSTITDTMVERITDARPTYIFLAIGGNDISSISEIVSESV